MSKWRIIAVLSAAGAFTTGCEPAEPDVGGTGVSVTGLQEVEYTFTMDDARWDAGEWDPAAGLTLHVTTVAVTPGTWRVGSQWLAEGTYTLDRGDYYLTVIQDSNGPSRHHTSGRQQLSPGAGAFRVACELLALEGEVLSDDLILHVYETDGDDNLRVPIRLDR